jgi:O-antigen ligase
VFGYLAFVPWTVLFVPHLSGHDYARVLEVVICSICSVAVAHHLWCTPSSFSNKAPIEQILNWRLWSVALVLFAMASVVMAPIVDRALQEFCILLSLVSLANVVAVSNVDVRFGERASIAATLLYCGIALGILWIGVLNGYAPNLEELGLGYINRRFFNHVQTVALPLAAVALHSPATGKAWRFAAWVCLISGFALLFFSGGRGTFVSIIGASLLSALWMGRSTWRCIRPLALGLLAGFFVYMLLFVQLPFWVGLPASADLVARAQEGGSVSARFELWHLALSFVRESPCFGIGPMHFAHRIHPDAAHPHNIYLQLAAEWGLPVLILLLTGAGVALVRFAKVVRATKDSCERCVGGSLLIACVAILLDGIVSGNFVMPVSQVWIAVCAGMALRWVLRHTPPEANATMRPTVRAWPGRVCAGLLFAVAVVQLVLLFRDAWSLEELLQRAAALSVNDYLNPRFWSNGWF